MASDFAVGFDFDHTLGLDHQLERTVALDGLRTLANATGILYDEAAADAAIDHVLREARRNERTLEMCIAGFYETFAASGGTHVVTAASAFREEVVARAPDFVTPMPGALDVLAALDRANVPYAMLTNGWSPLQEEKARLIAFRGPVFVSERIGAQKPAAGAFAPLVKHFALAASEIWYVGEDPAVDCVGALRAGLRSVWFDWEQRAYPPGEPQPTHTIHSLEELLAILPCA